MKGKSKNEAGGVKPKTSKEDKAGGNPFVFAEDKKKSGGMVKKHKEEKMQGAKAKHRLDKPGRKTGGRCGADKSPLSSAHSGSSGYEA